jgi:hypothetical protein
MAITTLDGALAGMQPTRPWAKVAGGTMTLGRPHSYWGIAGSPGAGSFDTTLNGVTLSSTSTVPNGSIYRTDSASNSYLARFTGASSSSGMLMLCDRLWHNGGIVNATTTAQSITFPTLPARDANGSTNGQDIMLGLEVSAAMGTGTAVMTAVYTNSAGTGSRAATALDTYAPSGVAGSFFRFALQSGDVGIRSVESVTLSVARTSGTCNLVAYRVLAAINVHSSNFPAAVDALTGGFPRIYNGTVPFLMLLPASTTTANMSGTYTETHG